ncbi:NAD(P)-binding protein, partial [Aureobasidium melanogenum]
MTAKHSLPIETAQIAMQEANLKARPSLTSAIDREVGISRSFTSDEEKKVLRKIDCFVLPMMCFVFFCQYLDKQSLSYASVAGLIQDLKMDASQYSWCSSIFYIGQLVSEYPFIYLMSRLRLTKLVGFTIVVWGGICMCPAAPVDFAGFAAVRFLLGFSEGAVSPAFVTITSYWYKKEEHALRTALWISMNALAQVVGSLLMFGIAGNKNLTIASWRVMFIVCGAMTVAIGIVFFFAMPSGPQDAWFLNEREKEVLAARMVKCHEGGDRNNFSVAQLREALQDVKVWLIFCFGLLVTMQSPVLTFASLIIKGLGYSSHETLLYVAPSGAVQLALIWIGVVLCASCITAPWSILLSLSASNIKGNTKRSVANAVFFIGYCIMLPISKRVALITGGSQGIGAATARLLASKGYFVAINYSSNTAKAEEIVKELGEQNTMSIQADAGQVSEIERMVEKTVQRCGRIDALVAAAAVFSLQEIADTTEGRFDSMMALNVKGPFFLAQKAAPSMPSGSHIVFMSTTQCHASTVTAPYLLYNMTKGAVEQMTRVLAKDFGQRGIFVNAVAPGPTATEMFLTGKSSQLLETLAGFNPHKRIARPEEIADTIAYLTESRWISGQVVKVNGGMA